METDKAMGYWLEELSTKAAGTKTSYLSHFNKFIERWGLTPDGLYEMHKAALESEDPRDRRKVVMMVRRHMKELLDSGKAPGTARGISKAVKSFLDANGLELNLKKKDNPTRIYNGQRIILPEQIRELHDSVGAEFKLRNRALIMFLKDSGLRVSDLSLLNVGDYMEALERRNEAGERFKIFEPMKTQKTRRYAEVHIGPEAVEALDDYLEERRDEGEDLTPDAPLFAKRGGGRLTSHALSNQLRRLCFYLGREGRKISAHSLRKFHTTRLEAKMPGSWIAKLQGKAASEYSQPELLPGELTQAYMEAYDQLRIFGAEAQEREAQRKEVDSLRQRVKEIEEENRHIKEEQKDMIRIVDYERLQRATVELRKELDELGDLMGQAATVFSISDFTKLKPEIITMLTQAVPKEGKEHLMKINPKVSQIIDAIKKKRREKV